MNACSGQAAKQSRKINKVRQTNANITKLEKRCFTLERLAKKYKNHVKRVKATYQEKIVKLRTDVRVPLAREGDSPGRGAEPPNTYKVLQRTK